MGVVCSVCMWFAGVRSSSCIPWSPDTPAVSRVLPSLHRGGRAVHSACHIWCAIVSFVYILCSFCSVRVPAVVCLGAGQGGRTALTDSAIELREKRIMPWHILGVWLCHWSITYTQSMLIKLYGSADLPLSSVCACWHRPAFIKY